MPGDGICDRIVYNDVTTSGAVLPPDGVARQGRFDPMDRSVLRANCDRIGAGAWIGGSTVAGFIGDLHEPHNAVNKAGYVLYFAVIGRHKKS